MELVWMKDQEEYFINMTQTTSENELSTITASKLLEFSKPKIVVNMMTTSVNKSLKSAPSPIDSGT